MRLVSFLKNWMLPIAMLTGVAAYFLYVNIPALDGTHQVVNKAIGYVQPALLFCMLFVSFCRMGIRELKPKAWMLELLAIQVVSFVAMGLLVVWMPDVAGRVVIESAMICMICPTATAAAVVTTKLHGNANVVVSYTCLINMAVSLVVPAMVPFLHESTMPDMTFEISFLLILAKVFPLLIMPLVVAWLVRHLFPKFHAFILRQPNLAFNLWAVSLSLAIGVSVKALVHSEESLWNMVGIAVASLVCCLLQFGLGRLIGRKYGEPVAGTQSLGQKNTVFAIWMGYTFLNPVTALAGGFYSLWHNLVNSWQLWRVKSEK
ncbi:MAG: transporter [Bacteroidaceae bacterium]|nr:transporter [Bacteroidaceae bacterium]